MKKPKNKHDTRTIQENISDIKKWLAGGKLKKNPTVRIDGRKRRLCLPS